MTFFISSTRKHFTVRTLHPFPSTQTLPHLLESSEEKKRKEIMPFTATWTNLEIIVLSEVSQTILYDITHMWNLIF